MSSTKRRRLSSSPVPRVLWLEILANLDWTDIFAGRRVCRQWRDWLEQRLVRGQGRCCLDGAPSHYVDFVLSQPLRHLAVGVRSRLNWRALNASNLESLQVLRAPSLARALSSIDPRKFPRLRRLELLWTDELGFFPEQINHVARFSQLLVLTLGVEIFSGQLLLPSNLRAFRLISDGLWRTEVGIHLPHTLEVLRVATEHVDFALVCERLSQGNLRLVLLEDTALVTRLPARQLVIQRETDVDPHWQRAVAAILGSLE